MLHRFAGITLILLFTGVLAEAGKNKWTTSGPFGGNFRRIANTDGLGIFGVNQVVFSSSDPNTTHLATDRGVYTFTVATPQGKSGDPVIENVDPPAAKIGEMIKISGKNSPCLRVSALKWTNLCRSSKDSPRQG